MTSRRSNDSQNTDFIMHRNTELEQTSEASDKSGQILSLTALELTASTMKTFRMRALAKRRGRRRKRRRTRGTSSSITERSGTFKSTKIK